MSCCGNELICHGNFLPMSVTSPRTSWPWKLGSQTVESPSLWPGNLLQLPHPTTPDLRPQVIANMRLGHWMRNSSLHIGWCPRCHDQISLSMLRIQVSVQILILLIFYSSQFILLIFHSYEHLQLTRVCCDCCDFCDCIFSQECDSVTSALFQETEVWVCTCFIVLCSSWSLP